MSDETKGVNTDSEEVIETDMSGVNNVTDDHDAGIGSPADEMETHNPDIDDYDEIIANADADAEEASGETETTGESDEAEETSGTEDEEEARIPKSRLDEVIAQRDAKDAELNELRTEIARERGIMEGRLQALENAQTTVMPEDTADPFEELLQGEPQEIIDALQENPAEFFTNMRKASEAKAQANIAAQREEEKYYEDLRNGLDAFAADHEGFMENVEKMHGVVNDSPIHNLVSAFAYEVEIPAMQAAHEEALAKATGDLKAAKAEGIKIGRAEAMKEFKAKGNAAVLDGSQSTQGAKTVVDPEISDTEKSGGLAKVLTDKLLKRRAASGG